MGKDAKGRKKRAGRRAEKDFPMVQLPVALFEDIAQILREEGAVKSLANLNRSNKLLHAITSPCLWETISVTKKSWKPRNGWNGMPSKTFELVKYITILGENDDPDDLFFWTPLLPRESDTFHDKTLGQLAHFWFPNLRYIIRVAPPSIRFARSGVPKPAVYLSDQNVIETQDLDVLKRFFLDIEERYGDQQSSKATKRTLSGLPWYRAVTVDHPEFHEKLEAVKNKPPFKPKTRKKGSHAAHGNGFTSNAASADILDYFLPFRRVANFTFQGLTSVWVHLLSTTEVEEMQYQIAGKVLRLFGMMRRTGDIAGLVDKENRPHLVFEFEREDVEGDIPDCDFEKLQSWLSCMGSQNVEAAKLRSFQTPFSMFIDLPQRVPDFKTFSIQTLNFHMHARANNFACERYPHCFPESIVVHMCMKPAPNADCYDYAEMQFTTEARTRILATGEFHSAWGHKGRPETGKEQYWGPFYFEDNQWKQDAADIARIEKLWFDGDD